MQVQSTTEAQVNSKQFPVVISDLQMKIHSFMDKTEQRPGRRLGPAALQLGKAYTDLCKEKLLEVR